MNPSATNSPWSAPDQQFDPMAGVAEHDFASFLDLGEIDLNFPTFDENNGTDNAEGSQQLGELSGALDMQGLSAYSNQMDAGQNHQQQQRDMQSQSNGFGNINMAQFGQLPQAQQQFSSSQGHTFQNFRGVPPTPNSVEMHPDAAQYLQQQQSMMEQPHYQNSFTPLVSPAVTPHDGRFQFPAEFTIPGSYLSPLTSPALEGQVHPSAAFSQNASQASGSSGTSPADLDIDMQGPEMPTEPSRKGRTRRQAAPRSTGPTPKVRQSPIVKAQRRKSRISTALPPKDVSNILEGIQQSGVDFSRPQSTESLALRRTRDASSGTDSISPEPLSEALMGPPPRPGSVSQSPNIVARGSHSAPPLSTVIVGQGVPATPASIMRLQKSPNTDSQTSSPSIRTPNQQSQQNGNTLMLDDLALPEAADTSRPDPTFDGPTLEDAPTPRASARKTPKLGPLASPSASFTLSAKQSPALGAMTSPLTASSPTTLKKVESRGGRGSKKRNNTSSALVSPALRPKISPSIRPMLPSGGVGQTDETHALLLASKSNYQNILEGTHIPGVTYSESLTTNLTSKRTSHKIAEQGRRNRINTALQEMQSLLPPTAGSQTPKLGATDARSNDSKSPIDVDDASGSKANAQGSSKAATVEQAIDYIKLLVQQSGEKDKVIEDKDREVEELRKKLAEMQRRFSDADEHLSPVAEKASPERRSASVESKDDATSISKMETDEVKT